MDADTTVMLRSSLARVLTEDGNGSLADRLDRLGWNEVLAGDAATALRLLFETRGATLSKADALGPLLAGAVADALGKPELAAATVVLPASLHPDRLSSILDGGVLLVSGVVLGGSNERGALVVPVAGGDEGEMRLAVTTNDIDLDDADSGRAEVSTGLARASGTVDATAITWVEESRGRAAWDAAVTRGRWALAAELVGISQQVIASSVEYAGTREQYGRPIGSFQAVQHRLASAHAGVVGATRIVAEAAVSGSPWVAKVAKAAAGRATESACTQAQQTYGAIGFTWEHGFHRYLRRAYVLDWLLGDWRALEFEIGGALRTTGEVPRIGVLGG